jgi:hypothetical protein
LKTDNQSRNYGFGLPRLVQSYDFGKQLGCESKEMGGIATKPCGRTNIKGVYSEGMHP